MRIRIIPGITLGAAVAVTASLLLAGWVASTAGVILYAVWLGLQSGMVRTLGAALLPAWFGTRHLGSIQGTMSFIGVLASAAGPIAFSLTESTTDSFRSTATLWAVAPLLAMVFALSKRPITT